MDIQRLAFLSCLLSIYQSNPVSDWGYQFANTGSSTPFSDQLSDAISLLVNGGHFEELDHKFQITDRGIGLLDMLGNQSSIIGRSVCVDAACASMLAVPLSTMTTGLDLEPTVAASHLRSSATMLLQEPHLQILHDHFQVLAKVLPPSPTDLFSPSVLWLSYMSEVKLSEHTVAYDAENH